MVETEQSTEFARGFEDAIVANGQVDDSDDDWRHLALLTSLCTGDGTGRCFVRRTLIQILTISIFSSIWLVQKRELDRFLQ